MQIYREYITNSILSVLVFSCIFSMYGCGDSAPKNLFQNSSFEEGREHWFAMTTPDRPFWADFYISDRIAHTGSHSALLPLRSAEYELDVKVQGLVQEFTDLEQLPEKLSGWYRVENWHRGTLRQYLQVVIIVWGAGNMPENITFAKSIPLQMAYVLGGITIPPFRIDNRRFIFQEKLQLQPVENEWLYFSFDLHKDFLEEWGIVPEDFKKVRILFEARFDGLKDGEDDVSADVYYDDLYFGG